MKTFLKQLAAKLANAKLVRNAVAHLIYPAVVECLRREVQPDIASPSGVVEAFAWKAHAYWVLAEELLSTGKNVCGTGLRHDPDTRKTLFDIVEERCDRITGDILEFGVAGGGSLLDLAHRFPNRTVFGFDTFEGLPEAWWTRPKGAFKPESLPQFPANVRLVKGLFSDTLPSFLKEWTGQAILVHVDCDLYSSTRTCLAAVLPRCQVGTLIVFDEYYNYSEFAQHEWKAWNEIKAEFGLAVECVAFDGRRAAFQILQLHAFDPRAIPSSSRFLESQFLH